MKKYLLKTLLRLDNSLRRWITYFSLESGLHPKHRLTNYHQFFLDRISPNETVLDIGCGLGLLAYDVARKARQVTGLDINEQYLTTAKSKHCLPNLTFIHGDATACNLPNKF